LSPDLRQRQHETISQRAPHLLERVCWLDGLPESGFCGVVLANEVVDAMPVHLLQFQDEGVVERCVACENNEFVWRGMPLTNPLLVDRVTELKKELGDEVFCPGYLSEVNLAQQGWLASIAAMLECGAVLVIDYGFPQHEYYHPDRTTGTLMCHYRHRAHGDPLILAGLQDITAHVDFTALAVAASEAGLDVLGYTSQAQFLLACGLGGILEEFGSAETRQYIEMTQAVKKLTMPSEMGELFKVIAVGRGLDDDLNGFSFQDRRHRL
jgi:SAM-dependent MidA family methyltransferase